MEITKITESLDSLLKKHSHPVNAKGMESYMKNRFSYYGLKSPERRELGSAFWKEHGWPEKEEIIPLCKSLWMCKHRELKYVAMDLLKSKRKKLDCNAIPDIEQLILTESWWDTVDFLAANLLGGLLKGKVHEINTYVPDWIASPNMWLNRTAILFQLKYKTDTDTKLLEECIRPHITSKEFYHQKAIGWMLREYGKTDPHWVLGFCSKYVLAPLSKREALRIIKKGNS